MDQRIKEPRIEAFGSECRAFGKHTDRIVTVQAFLVTCDNPEIPDPFVFAQGFAEQAGGIFNENQIGCVELGKRLFIFAFYHDLRFGWHC